MFTPTHTRRLAGVTALCAIGALAIAPSTFAADSTATAPVPSADAAKIASKYRTSISEVLKRQAQLAPAIKALAPNAVQPTLKPRLKATKIAKAAVDECFVAIGQDGPAPDADGNCPAGSKPKRNQVYPFGATRSGDFMYFGTAGNTPCAAPFSYGITVAEYANDEIVCEGNRGYMARHFGWPRYGDMRRPQVMRINADTNKPEDITPTDAQAPSLKYSSGLRGQGAKDDVVLLGGVTMNSTGNAFGGVELLAYEGSTGKFLGETLLPAYANIRRGNVIDGELYFGVRLAGTGSGTGGAVVKWTGSKTDPFKFEVVAQGLPSEPGYITGHEHHIITAGWTTVAGQKASGAMPTMYQSPTIPEGGLTNATADASNWKPIFKSSDYDPDPVIANAVQFGDLTSYQGKLVFSTYNYGGFDTLNAFSVYGRPDDEIARLNTYINAERAAAVFEMTNVGEPDQKVRLLYGDAKLPVYNTAGKRWEPKNNNLNQTPKFGAAGFGNRFNSYSWMWEQYKGSLYMSTFDASSLLKGIGPALTSALVGLSPQSLDLLQPVLNTSWTVLGGGDVWRFDSLDAPALPENLDGFGNKNAHGVRAWTAFEDKGKLMAGMATWANLNNTAKNSGGWEVNELKG